MTAEQLRNSLLQEAISGRLVPQDPNDEPVSALLARIQEEKERLIKEKKLKKEKSSAPITEDDIPFEIPATWEWVRLIDILSIKSGDGINVRSLKENAPYPVYGGNGINGTYDQYNVEPETLIIGRVGFYCGAIHKTYSKAWVTDNALIVTYIKDCIFVDYLKYALTTLKIRRTSNSTAQPVVSGKGIYPLLFPLPPLAEQQRIVAKLEELLPIIEQYGKAQTELDELNATLPSRLRQSILQQAIQGKLVPQDPNEGTAEELVLKLQNAIEVSQIKKKWSSEQIQEDELPFDIPNNWQWTRLGDIVYTQTGLSYSKGDLEKKVSNPVRVLRGGNIQSGSWCIKDDDVMIAPEFVKKDIFLKKNSFITPAVTSLEHLGKTALIREDHNDIVAGGFVLYLMPYDASNDLLMEYLAYFFQSAFYNSFCKTITNKSGQAFWNISREKLLQLIIPLPPLAEQQRIVTKIEELFAEIDKLTK